MGISPSSLVCPLVSFFVQLMLERSFYGCNWEFCIGETFLDVALGGSRIHSLTADFPMLWLLQSFLPLFHHVP